MTYNYYDDSVQATPTPRTPREKYKEALRVTQIICLELADEEDDNEFQEMIAFVVKQSRNVRQCR